MAGSGPRSGPGASEPAVRVGGEERPPVDVQQPGGRGRPEGPGSGPSERASECDQPEVGSDMGAERDLQPDAKPMSGPPAGGERIELSAKIQRRKGEFSDGISSAVPSGDA